MGTPHIPTAEQRTAIKYFKVAGMTNEQIARQFNIDTKTLAKHYRFELDHGLDHLKGVIIGALMTKVMSGDTASIIFASKTICGLKETHVQEYAPPNIMIQTPDGVSEPMPIIHAQKVIDV